MNLGKCLTASLSKLVSIAIESAQTSQLALRHGAVLFSSKNQIQNTCCNQVGTKICGFDVPSLHAEANCLRPIHNRAGKFGCRHQGRKAKRYEKWPLFLW